LGRIKEEDRPAKDENTDLLRESCTALEFGQIAHALLNFLPVAVEGELSLGWNLKTRKKSLRLN
jgi:hypothetical protein